MQAARSVAIGALAVAVLRAPAVPAAPIVVGPLDGSCPGAVFGSVQAALDAAPPRANVVVCAGTYGEQLVITKPVRLTGRPGARLAPTGIVPQAESIRTGRPVAAVLTVRAPATIEGFVIDASAHGLPACEEPTTPLLAAVFIRGVAATLRANSVTGPRFPDGGAGCSNGVGILAQGSGDGTRIRLEGNSVDGYQRAGMSVGPGPIRAALRENVVTGLGTASPVPQVGIEFDSGVVARLEDNLVRDHRGRVAARCSFATGIVVRGANARLDGSQLTGNTVGLHLGGRGHRVFDTTVDGDPEGLVGVQLEADASRFRATTIRRVGGSGLLVTGHRNRFTDTTVASVRASAACQAAPCPTPLGQCGAAVWLTGRANHLDGSVLDDNDVPVVDDGRANVIR